VYESTNILLGKITLMQAIPPTAKHFSVAWSVVLHIVCHIRAPYLNRLTDLDAIWQVYIVLDGVHGRIGVKPPAKTYNCKLHAAIRRIEMRSDSTFSQITLVLVYTLIKCGHGTV